jgi:hypothetical protein
MSTTRPPRLLSTPTQRLSCRLLRHRGFSLSQISAVIGLSVAVSHYLSSGVTAENLKQVTLEELGAPEDQNLFAALLMAATSFLDQRLDRLQVGPPRGNASPAPAALAA